MLSNEDILLSKVKFHLLDTFEGCIMTELNFLSGFFLCFTSTEPAWGKGQGLEGEVGQTRPDSWRPEGPSGLPLPCATRFLSSAHRPGGQGPTAHAGGL